MKAKKILALTLAVASVGALSVGLAACGGTDYDGEYKYANPYAEGSYYGVKVKVTVSGDEITKVVIVDSDYTQLSPANDDYGWTEAKRKVYSDGEAALLKKYEGAKVSDIQKIKVTTSEGGEPDSNKTELGDYIIEGATQSSGRLMLAVQNALKDVK